MAPAEQINIPLHKDYLEQTEIVRFCPQVFDRLCCPFRQRIKLACIDNADYDNCF